MTATTESPLAVGLRQLPTDRLRPNTYNPNRMADDQFAELVVEVRHLGRLPKPVVARSDGNGGLLIVDGEHNWRAAREVGLAEIPVEVIEADDFEAMRQTYKRNQHGDHNPVLLGRMFRQMNEDRGLSQRVLAKEIEVSEGTIRNALAYADAAEVRNRYASGLAADDRRKDTADADIARLTVRQVRTYVKLPEKVRDLWIGPGKADLEAIKKAVLRRGHCFPDKADDEPWTPYYRRMEEDGLLDYLSDRGIYNPATFSEAISKLRRWDQDCRAYAKSGLDVRQIRPYMKHFSDTGKLKCWANDRWEVGEKPSWMVDGVMGLIIEPPVCSKGGEVVRPASFRITPEQFDAVVDEICEGNGGSYDEFSDMVRVAVASVTGSVPTDRKTRISEELLEIEVRSQAPEYIATAPLHIDDRHFLWKAEAPDEIKQRLINAIVAEQAERVEGTRDFFIRNELEIVPETIVRPTRNIKKRLERELRHTQAEKEFVDNPPEKYAEAIADFLYTEGADRERIRTKLLAVFTKEELAGIFEATKETAEQHALIARLKCLLGGGSR